MEKQGKVSRTAAQEEEKGDDSAEQKVLKRKKPYSAYIQFAIKAWPEIKAEHPGM